MRRTLLILAGLALVTMAAAAALTRTDTLHPLLAHQETLEAISTALGGGEDVKTSEVYSALDGVTTVLVSRVAGKKIVGLGLILNVPSAATVTMIDGGTAGGTRKEAWEFPAKGGLVEEMTPLGWFEYGDGNSVSIFADGSSVRLKLRYMERTP